MSNERTKMNKSAEIEIVIPAPLRVYTNKQKFVKIKASTIREGMQILAETYSGIKNHLFDENGKIRNFVNIYLNDEDIRNLKAKIDTQLIDGQKITILPSIAGGV
ncbi:MAG: MoaD/ThiS family protein [Candidatus Thorarchaeota archaeon]